jgi:hypothetical protein
VSHFCNKPNEGEQSSESPNPQSDKFKALARELECDEDEAAFDEKLKRVAKQPQSERGKSNTGEADE